MPSSRRAYREELAEPPDVNAFERDLDSARLHLALQNLGWSQNWEPPPEHAQDWRAEIVRAVERLGL